MAEPPEFWAFILTNLGVLVMGGILTVLSFRAYRRSGTRSFRLSSVGFGLVTLGGILEAIYELGIQGDYHLGARELLVLQTIESVLIALGLFVLYYSLRNY